MQTPYNLDLAEKCDALGLSSVKYSSTETHTFLSLGYSTDPKLFISYITIFVFSFCISYP